MRWPFLSSSSSGESAPALPVWSITIAVALLVWASTLAYIVYPGEISPDTLDQYLQGVRGDYTTAHPPLLAFFMGLSDRIAGSIGPLFLVQLALAVLAVGSVAPLVPASWSPRIVYLFLAFFPIVWAQWLSVWKDCWVSILYLLALSLLARRQWVLPMVLMAVMCAFRHNAFPLVAPIALFLGWQLWSSWRKLLGVAVASAVLLTSFALPRGIDFVLGARDVHPAAPSLLFDVAGVYTRDAKAFSEGPFAATVTLEDVKERHRPDTARLITSDRRGLPGMRFGDFVTDESYEVLQREWMRVVVKYPGAYVSHRLQFTACYLGVCGEAPLDPYGKTYSKARGKMETASTKTRIYKDLEVGRSMLVRPFARGAYCVLPLLILAAMAAWRKRWLECAIGGSALAYTLLNLVFAPSAPFRYHLPEAMALLVLVALVAGPDPIGAPAAEPAKDQTKMTPVPSSGKGLAAF